jgi:hypothetical protein
MTSNEGRRAILGIVASLAMVALLFPPAVLGTPETMVSVEDGEAATYETDTVAIRITDVTNLGAATIWLSYDKDVVTVDSVADGDMGTVTYGIHNGDGVTKMAWAKTGGMSGDFVFARVTLHAVGSPGETSTLDLDVKNFADISFNPVATGISDGLFTVSGARPTTARVPSLSHWGIVAMITLFAALLVWMVRRRQVKSA